jgi:hypothetical protein
VTDSGRELVEKALQKAKVAESVLERCLLAGGSIGESWTRGYAKDVPALCDALSASQERERGQKEALSAMLDSTAAMDWWDEDDRMSMSVSQSAWFAFLDAFGVKAACADDKGD